jgi:antitoxin component of MazEF toxin-antitoxin module
MVVSMLAGCGGNTTKPQLTQGTELQLTPDLQSQIRTNNENRIKMEEMISEIEKQLQLKSDGTLVINPTTRASLSPEAQKFAEIALEKTNEGVLSGNLTIDNDLTIHAKNNTNIRANENSFRVYWWGFQWGLNNSRARWVTGALAPLSIWNISGALQSIGVPPGYSQLCASFAKIYCGLIGWANEVGGSRGVWIKNYWPNCVIIYQQS